MRAFCFVLGFALVYGAAFSATVFLLAFAAVAWLFVVWTVRASQETTRGER